MCNQWIEKPMAGIICLSILLRTMTGEPLAAGRYGGCMPPE